ncbi:3-hydroxybutyrate dehydrogenase [Rubrimonas cliftonensis]|uniref:3-hydroxybutyrate dehydrogenase n=1 Tax=Rubrimonas cliftonensis TaxID=89524 RepID=A0A1H4E817_9RHOB|nr:3-hydroxybutyrate dehydrogenase [Rubrimonas cliftonensis]SEA81046.1 3-hydroxybutyrate dehydrogenase [Rubrimonas cliftonensis]
MDHRRTAVVTGSTSGIGQGVARALAASGMNVMLNGFGDRDAIEAERAAMAEETGADIAHDGADMSRPDEIARFVETTRARFGAIDVVVNNAGVQTVAPIEDFPPDRYDLIMAINMSAAWHLTRLTFAAMKAEGWGRVINVASAHGLVASPFKSAYVMAKHAVIGLTKTVALEGAEHGVTCNAICPGYVLTPLVEKQIPETAKARGLTEAQVKRDVLLAAQPTREFATVEEIGALAAFLCTDAAKQITGAALPVDGGWTAQ